MIVDSHCHLHFDAFDPDRDAVIERALKAGVRYFVNVGTDPATNLASYELSQKYDCMVSTVGLHPHHSEEVPWENLGEVDAFIKKTKPAAVGEIGLDYFKSAAEEPAQKKVFSRMLQMAMENDLPVIVHSRNAFKDTLEIIKAETQGKLRGVMHCFSYDKEALGKLLDLGFLVSFTCNITFKNAADLLSVASFAPLDKIMLETDAPYLAPQIYRGKRNEPICLIHLAEFLAEKRGIPQEELERVTSQTAIDFFKLPTTHA